MSFQSVTNKRKSRTNKLLWLGALVAVFVVVLMQSTVFGLFAQWIGMNRNWGTGIESVMTSRIELVRENELLRAQIREDQVAQAMAGVYQQQYQEMWQHYTGVEESVVTGAEVLLRPPYSAYDYLVIDKGSLDGVVNNQYVVADGQYVVGYVDQVRSDYSRVMLFSAAGAGHMFSVDGGLYPAVGQGAGVSYIRLPRSFTDSDQQVVRIPGAGAYTLGVLETASFRPQDSYVTGVLTSPVNIFGLERVSVVREQYTDSVLLDDTFDEVTVDN